MIGRLKGTIVEKKPPYLLLDVSGVGYELSAPMSTFYSLPEVDETTTLLTHLVVREDAQKLYGFYTDRERSLFRALIKVNGVGPKLALTILSGIEPDTFVQCVHQGDTTSLVSIPGIGKKTAERLIIELRGALEAWETNAETNPATASNATSPNHIMQDAISALTALGYKALEAKNIIQKIHAPDLNSEALIRLALKQMVRT